MEPRARGHIQGLRTPSRRLRETGPRRAWGPPPSKRRSTTPRWATERSRASSSCGRRPTPATTTIRTGCRIAQEAAPRLPPPSTSDSRTADGFDGRRGDGASERPAPDATSIPAVRTSISASLTARGEDDNAMKLVLCVHEPAGVALRVQAIRIGALAGGTGRLGAARPLPRAGRRSTNRTAPSGRAS